MQIDNNSSHVNAFVVNDGIPYLIGAYVDNAVLRTIDRALIKDDIVIDTTEAMRPVIDISIDTIGRNASDGLPSIIGNTTRYTNLLSLINNLKYQLDGKFPVIRAGLVVRIYYQLENNRTGQVIRTMIEDIQIKNNSVFIDINKDNINDNAIIVHFSESMMSTVNQFTSGSDQMILRITSIELCYDVITNDATVPRLQGVQPGAILASVYDNQFAGVSGKFAGDWYLYDRFYHFDSSCKDIIIHDQEIYDYRNKLMRIQCGQIQVNRFFLINPGARIVFKFSIWKNDIILVNDTTEIASNLGVSGFNFCPTPPNHGSGVENPPFNNNPCSGCTNNYRPAPDINGILNEIYHMNYHMQQMDYKQNATVNQLVQIVKSLAEQVKTLGGDVTIPEDLPTDLPEENEGDACCDHHPCHHFPPPPPPPPCDNIGDTLNVIRDQVTAIQDQVDDIKEIAEDEAAEPDVVPMTDEDILNAVKEANESIPSANDE